jgi:hypothetical protein
MTKRVPLTRAEKERKVIELFEKGMNIRDIAKRAHMSFTDIGIITRKHSGDEGLVRSKKYSKDSQALQLFQMGYTKLQVAIELGLTDSDVIEKFKQFMVLNGFDRFCEFYHQTAGDMESYLFLHNELKLAGVTGLRAEHDGLVRENMRLSSENNKLSNELQFLEQKKNIVLGVLEQANAAVWNDIRKKQPMQ